MKYVFPAVFTPEGSAYSVRFPDLPNCFTSGETLSEALDMARDALNLVLMTMEDDGIAVPGASLIQAVPCADGEFSTLVGADTAEYRKLYGNYAVKKTLSIPAWLNTLAEKSGVNFSSTLQKALKAELNLN